MEFRTTVQIPRPSFLIEPLEKILFVGSCFADNIGLRFKEERFPVIVNPYGTMYNPVSVCHTIERYCSTLEHDEEMPRIVFITLGTNHVYRLKETGEIVDNCQKRPARLFDEEQLTQEECSNHLLKAINILRQHRPDTQVVLTVSPIRYAKYGFHESQLSKATLLLATHQILSTESDTCFYFPAYEIVLDELRDYRFYKEDMLHPSTQAIEYLWERLSDSYFSTAAKQFLKDWKPIKEALQHRPFHAESEEYKKFLADTKQKEMILLTRFGKTL